METVTFREGSNKLYQSSLEGLGYEITSYRRNGNTTRIIDNAIQILFRGFVCVVHDHYEMGKNRDSNENLMHRIMDRLVHEHDMKIGKDFRINWDRFEIEFISIEERITSRGQEERDKLSLLMKQMKEASDTTDMILAGGICMLSTLNPIEKCNHNAVEDGMVYRCSICNEIL